MTNVTITTKPVKLTVKTTKHGVTVTQKPTKVSIKSNPTKVTVSPRISRVTVKGTGIIGPQGLPGTPGTVWIVDSGGPSVSQGNDGDLYLDTNTNQYYEKVAGNWVLQGTFGGDPCHEHIQSTASHQWVVNHNFNRSPKSVQVYVGACEVEASIVNLNSNTTLVCFVTPQTGTVYVT